MTQIDSHIGENLRARREEMKLSVAELAKTLNLKPNVITAIEELNTSELPSIGYVLGYVRAYAGYVGLNGPDSVAQYKIDTDQPDNLGLRDRPHFVPKKSIRLPRGIVPALFTMACAAGVIIWYSSGPAPDAGQTRLAAALETVGQTAAAGTTAIAEDRFVIKTTGPSWVQFRGADDEVIMSRIMVSGESWIAPQDTGITVSARDGGALVLYKGEELMGVMGERGVPFVGLPLAIPTGGITESANLTVMTLENTQ